MRDRENGQASAPLALRAACVQRAHATPRSLPALLPLRAPGARRALVPSARAPPSPSPRNAAVSARRTAHATHTSGELYRCGRARTWRIGCACVLHTRRVVTRVRAPPSARAWAMSVLEHESACAAAACFGALCHLHRTHGQQRSQSGVAGTEGIYECIQRQTQSRTTGVRLAFPQL